MENQIASSQIYSSTLCVDLQRQVLESLVDSVRAALVNEPELDSGSIHRVILKQMQIQEGFDEWTLKDRRHLESRVFSTIYGLGVLEGPLHDPRVTEIMVNGLEGIFVEIKGCLLKWPESFSSQIELERVIHRMLSKINRVVNTAQPIVDGRLSDGSRLHVVMHPIAINGPIVTIRKFHSEIRTLENLIASGSLDQEAAKLLKAIVNDKRNLLVSGGTGTGKTTLLNLLSLWINTNERIVTVEDACELNLEHLDNWVQLEVRQATSDDLGSVSIRDLVRASLRMRPDRIVVGEVRGDEVLDMLQAMNTGHEGSMSSVHANSIRDVLSRLESLLHMHTSFSIEAIKSLLISSLDIIVHLERARDGRRFVSQIASLDKENRREYVLKILYQKHDSTGTDTI